MLIWNGICTSDLPHNLAFHNRPFYHLEATMDGVLWIIALLLLSASKFAASQENETLSEMQSVAKVIHRLDWSQGVRILAADSAGTNEFHNLCKALSASSIFVIVGDQESVGQRRFQSLPWVFYSHNDSDITEFVDVLADGDFASEELMLLTNHELGDAARDLIKSSGYSRSFFYHQIGQSPDTIARMQTFREGDNLLTMNWGLDERGERFLRDYNFQGARMSIITTMNDFPYMVVVPRPDNPTMAAAVFGSDIDVLDVLTRQFNFTYQVHIQLDNDWGVESVSGETADQSNASYSGIFGRLIAGEFDRTSQAWQHNLERHSLFDFSISVLYMRGHYMMDVSRAKRPDWELYVRPFHSVTWYGSIAMVAVVLAAYHGLDHFALRCFKFEAYDSLKVIGFFGWLCYLVAEIYWEGALTMFFTTEPDLPFNSIEEGLSLYPDYKFVLPRDLINGFYQSAKSGIKGMDEQLERLDKDPDLVLENRLELLEALKTPGTFTAAHIGEMALLMELFKITDLNLQVLFPATTNNGYYSIIYPKRSPWRDALDQGYRLQMSSGQSMYFTKKYLPSGLTPEAAELAGAIDLRQTALVFVLLGGLYVVAILTLFVEFSLRNRETVNKGLSRSLDRGISRIATKSFELKQKWGHFW